MGKEKETEINVPEALKTMYAIEELQQKSSTANSIFKGACVAYGWKPGKMVTEDEYVAAINKFSSTPIGKKVKEC